MSRGTSPGKKRNTTTQLLELTAGATSHPGLRFQTTMRCARLPRRRMNNAKTLSRLFCMV